MSFDKKTYNILFIFCIIFLIIWIKMFYIQIIDKSLKKASENNTIRRITIYPSRGLIFDRNEKLLVYNEAAYDLFVTPIKIKDLDTVSLCKDLNISIEYFRKKLSKCIDYSTRKPSIIYSQITAEQYARLQEYLYKYKGFNVHNRTLRKYDSDIAAHILGDIGEIDMVQLNENTYYNAGDYIGKSGIEKYYEKELRGKKGVEYFLVDVNNNVKDRYQNGDCDTMAQLGKNLILTIDANLQKYGEELMKNKRGAIVAIEPATGEILTMVSSPNYPPQLMVGRQRGNNYDSLLNLKDKVLINRALYEYPPGSVFKIAQALVGLSEKIITQYTFFPCDKSKVGCHNHPPCNGVHRAIQYSCNPYFYYVFRELVQRGIEKNVFKDARVGLDLWKEKIVTLGFNKSFDIGLPNVKKGHIPDADYYDRLYKKHRWAFSTIYSLAIGQGEVMVTPLQIANFCAILANRGFYYEPHIVKKIDDKNVAQKEKIRTPFDRADFEIIVQGMDWVVNGDYGTGYLARIPEINVCGKTGTVQNPKGKDHSVFIAFAPKDEPKIAIAVYVENAGFGGVWAAPIARLLMEKYLKTEISDNDLEKRILETNLLEN